jgi:hypothetical protein
VEGGGRNYQEMCWVIALLMIFYRECNNVMFQGHRIIFAGLSRFIFKVLYCHVVCSVL